MFDSALMFNELMQDTEKLLTALQDSVADTEAQFLTIGRNLADFRRTSEAVSEKTIEMAEVVRSANSGQGAVKLKHAISKMREEVRLTKERVAGGRTAMMRMRETISSVKAPLESFTKIVKKLSILSISTKIESSQLNRMEIDFINLADDVEKLAKMIREKSTKILKNTQSIDVLLIEALRRTAKIEKTQEEEMHRLLEGIESNLEAMKDKNVLAAHTSDAVSSELTNIGKNIDEVIVSLQFHDIARQQIDHVHESVKKIQQKLLPEMKRIDESRSEEEEQRLLTESGCVFQLQKSQLENTNKVFVHAVDNLTGHLRNITSNIFSISNKMHEIIGTSDAISSSCLSEVESGASMVISALMEDRKGKDELSDVIAELFEIVNSMSQWVEEIEEIGTEIQLIAVNARIKAAHAGREGAPLGVIAEAIQNLSGNAASEKTQMSEVLKNVISTTHVLRNTAIDNDVESTDDTKSIITDLKGTLRSIEASNGNIRDATMIVERMSRELANSIESTLTEFTVGHTFAKIMNGSTVLLQSMYDRITHVVPDEAWNGKNGFHLDEVKRNYTMQSERLVHKTYEATKARSTLKRLHNTENIDQQFGSNVELF